MSTKMLSFKGLDLIKSFEGCRLKAYKCLASEKYYTIGYGHYGADVHRNQVITRQEAECLLAMDLFKYYQAVMIYDGIYDWTQNELDVMISFAYNCGVGAIKTITNNGKRTKPVIANKLVEYNKSGGKVVKGLTNRRKKEREIFLNGY